MKTVEDEIQATVGDVQNLPRSHKAAIAVGSKYYFSKRCVNGHDAPRYTSSLVCVQCARFYLKSAQAKRILYL